MGGLRAAHGGIPHINIIILESRDSRLADEQRRQRWCGAALAAPCRRWRHSSAALIDYYILDRGMPSTADNGARLTKTAANGGRRRQSGGNRKLPHY